MSLIDLKFTNLSPPLITLGDCLPQDLIFAMENLNLKNNERVLLSAILTVLSSDRFDHGYCNAEAIAEKLNRKVVTVRQTLKKLVEKSVFIELGCNVHESKKRYASLFKLNIDYLNSNSLPAQPDQISLSLQENKALSVSDKIEYGLADDLVCLFLFTALEYNSKSTSKRKETTVYINDEPIKVTVTTTNNERIARINDLRYYMALLSLVERTIEYRINAANVNADLLSDVKSTLFDFFEVDILKAMGKGVGSGERNNLKISMNRLSGTEFFIENANTQAMKEMGLDEYELNVIHFKIREYKLTTDKRVAYRLEFEQRLINRIYQYLINNQRPFSKIDMRLMSETNSLRIAFSIWCSHQSIGGGRYYSWQVIKDKIAPSYSMKQFKQAMSDILAKAAVNDSSGNPCVTWLEDKKIIHQCSSEINEASIIYSEELGFYIARTSTHKNYLEMIRDSRTNRFLNF